jgi:hypothetical protein
LYKNIQLKKPLKASVNKQPVIVNEQRNYEYSGMGNFAIEGVSGA